MPKKQDICPNCNKISTYCVCITVLKGGEVSRLLPSINDLNGKSQVHHPQYEIETSFDLNGKKNSIKSFSDKNSFPKSSLRRSSRLKGEKLKLVKCKTCMCFNSVSEHEEHLKQHAITNLYKCKHCSKNYKSKAWLSKHQCLVDRDKLKNSFKKDRLIKKLDGRNACTCSFCDTKFISYSDYRAHIISQSCTCGQRFQCAYIFCSHTSKCMGNAPVWECIVDQNQESGDSDLIFSSKGVHNDLVNQSSNNLTEEIRESSHMFTDEFVEDIDTDDSLLSSATSAELYLSDGWCMQFISDLCS